MAHYGKDKMKGHLKAKAKEKSEKNRAFPGAAEPFNHRKPPKKK